MELNFIDIGIVVFIVITALVGLARGFIWMSLFLATWVAAAVLAFLYHDELMTMLPFQLSSKVFQMIVAALIIFLGILFHLGLFCVSVWELISKTVTRSRTLLSL